MLEEDADYIADRNSVVEEEVKYSKKLLVLKNVIAKHKKKPEASVKDSDSVTTDSESKRVPVKLPRFVIKGFSGEPTEYESFKQSFTEAIDKHPDLSAIEKMNYLISYLSDEALRCVKGLQLSHQNYETAKEMLEKRFGNKQLVISSHVKKLLDLEFIDSKNVKDICLPLEDQVINLAQSKYKHLQDLKLADQNPDNLPLQIDVLIGSADYWNFIGQKQIRSPNGPTAISSELGYVLSGPVEGGGKIKSSTANVVSTHFMRAVQTDRTEDKLTDLNKAYDTDWRKTLTEEDITVLQDFEKSTVFEEGRYHVSRFV
ncbi:uncharacterized protein [Clytia hemisphaerica]|uniref:uncharacterized protein n=1 Tax=Clytia hemisphaerica TaxID=252671 RepID=UPI0034D3C0BD